MSQLSLRHKASHTKKEGQAVAPSHLHSCIGPRSWSWSWSWSRSTSSATLRVPAQRRRLTLQPRVWRRRLLAPVMDLPWRNRDCACLRVGNKGASMGLNPTRKRPPHSIRTEDCGGLLIAGLRGDQPLPCTREIHTRPTHMAVLQRRIGQLRHAGVRPPHAIQL